MLITTLANRCPGSRQWCSRITCGIELKRRQQNVLIATAGLYMGRRHVLVPINRHYLPPLPRATRQLHQTGRGTGERWGDGSRPAYVEAVGSLHTLGGLQYLGWNYRKIAMARFFVIKPTMTNRACNLVWAAYLKVNGESAVEEVQRLAIPVLTSATVIKLLISVTKTAKTAWQGQSSRPVMRP